MHLFTYLFVYSFSDEILVRKKTPVKILSGEKSWFGVNRNSRKLRISTQKCIAQSKTASN